MQHWKVFSKVFPKKEAAAKVCASIGWLSTLANQADLIDGTVAHRIADLVNAGKQRLEEGLNLFLELTAALVNERLIGPARKMLKEARQQALELLRDKKALRRALKQQLGLMSPKITRSSNVPPAEKEPWGRLEIVICIVFTLFSVGMIGWAVVNTRNMAVSSFPIFAANPEFAWGVGGVIALLALFLEMIPDFFGFKGMVKKIYHGAVGVVTAAAAMVWVALFAKSAGLLGHGGGISADLESILAPEGTFLGLLPEQQDLLLTSSQFALEFLLPALGLAYVYQLVRSHGQAPPQVIVEDNPDYQRLAAEIERVSVEISELKKQIKAPARFEKHVGDILKQYRLKAQAYLLECCGQVRA
jgi:hypothetical protein